MRSMAVTNIIGDGTNIVSVLGIIDHEDQNLAGSFNTGASSQAGNSLNQVARHGDLLLPADLRR